MGVIAVIPARYASNRFPGKVLADKTGRYLVQHVYDRVWHASLVDDVIVATDDDRVVHAVESFGGRAHLTRPDHPSGTDRVAEVADALDSRVDIVLNVQGDEPEINPDHVDRLVDVMREQRRCAMATLACPFPSVADPTDVNCVKVVLDRKGRALYFSRSLIPFVRDEGGDAGGSGPLLHMGIYGYRRSFLRTFAELPPTPLEKAERLEQLRALEHGYDVAVGVVDRAPPGIDTPEEYEAFVRRWQQSASGRSSEVGRELTSPRLDREPAR